MISKILAAAAGASLVFASLSAEAMPAGANPGASAAPQITLAAEGCGPGFVRGPAGGCRRRGGGVVVVEPRRAVVVRPVRPRCGVRVPGVAIVTPC